MMTNIRRYLPMESDANAMPVSQVVVAGSLAFLAGEIGLRADGTLAEGIQEQTEAALNSMAKHLADVGGSLDDVTKVLSFLVDMDDFAAYNMVYRRFFPRAFPARSTVAVKELALGARIEIEAVAVLS